MRSSVALTLCAAIFLPTLTGCENNVVGSSTNPPSSVDSSVTDTDGTQIAALAQATFVTWSNTGEYTTTLTSEDADLSDVEAADAAVFTIPEAEVESVEDLPEPISYPVKEVKKNGDALDITFTDDKASEKSVDCYTTSIEKKNLGAAVLVDYPAPEVTLEGTGILVSDEDPEIALTLDSGLFASEIKPEQISLAGSFSEMEVEKVTPSSNKLIVKLKGKAEIPDGQSVYVDGIIGINPSAMENEHASALVRVPILQSLTMFDSSKMTVDGETVTVPLNVIGEEDIDGITAKDIVFDNTTVNDDNEEESLPNVTVTAVEKVDDTTLNVTMTVEGAKDKNSAAEILDGRTVTLRENMFPANFHPASIYPTFDYVEEDGDNLKLGLIVGVQGGTLADDFSAEQVSLGEDFADGTIISAERTDDVTAELTVSVPANGQTKEEFSYNGAVILKEGALINSWGDKTTADTEYIRSYTQDSVGRTTMGVWRVELYSTLASRLGIANGIMAGATAVFAITTLALELSGAVKTAAQQVMEINEGINRNLEDTFDVIKQNSSIIDDVEDIMLLKYLNDFNLKLAMLNTYVQKFSHYYSPGMLKLLGYDSLEEIDEKMIP